MFEALRSIDWNALLPPMPPGGVALVGAGPGDPSLITLRAAVRIIQADAVVYDALANDDLLRLAAPTAQRIHVGKRAGAHKMDQQQINHLLIDLARQGKRLARLKGGDPLIFGRGSEEAEQLRQAGLPFEIVPGVTAAAGAAAYAGIPLTDRRFTSTVTFVTGHEDPSKGDSTLDHAALAKMGSIVLYMGMRTLPDHARALIAAGMSADTPAAVVSHATLPNQQTVVGTLADIADRAKTIQTPALTLIGHAVSLRRQMDWFTRLPLFGKTIAVTRTRRQASELTSRLTSLGAQVIETPTIELLPGDPLVIDRTLANLPSYHWLIVTSVNGVASLVEEMLKRGLDGRALGHLRIAAIGPATGAALRHHFLRADVIPEIFTAEGLAQTLRDVDDFAKKRVLLFRADIARTALSDALTSLGAQCDDCNAYHIVRPAELPPQLQEALDANRLDWITFTSSSTFDNLRKLLGPEGQKRLRGVRIASIGPITSQTIRNAGLEPTVEADPYTIEALANAITAHETRH